MDRDGLIRAMQQTADSFSRGRRDLPAVLTRAEQEEQVRHLAALGAAGRDRAESEAAASATSQAAKAISAESGRAEHDRIARTLRDAKSAAAIEFGRLAKAGAETRARLGTLGCPWHDPAWDAWSPTTALAPPYHAAIGTLRRPLPSGFTPRGTEPGRSHLAIPALVPIAGGIPLVLSPSPARRPACQELIDRLLLRLLASLPPGRLQFVFIDPLGRGESAAAFTYLADHDRELIGGQVWTESAHIQERLVDLTAHIEIIIQKRLRTDYADLEAYNAANESMPAPYKVLVVFDFPAAFTADAVERLRSIMQSGVRCGVLTVILRNMGIKTPHGISPRSLLEGVTHLVDDTAPALDHPAYAGWTLEPEASPPPALRRRIVESIGPAAVGASQMRVPFRAITRARDEWWSAQTIDGIDVPLGPAGAKKIARFRVGSGVCHHVLVAGKIGSGKSTLLHTLVQGAIIAYPPEEIQLYLIDLKQVEFKPYADAALPHARVVAVESDPEFALAVLEDLAAQMARRLDLFTRNRVQNLAAYRRLKPSEPLPRILLVMDEFQVLLGQEGAISTRAAQILDQIVRLGRAPGIHILLASQSLSSAHGRGLPTTTAAQMAVRIALICNEADSRLILGEDNGAARLLSRPGEAIYNDAEGRVEGNTQFQVAIAEDAERDAILREVAEKFADRERPVVFDGSGLGCPDLHPLISSGRRAPAPLAPELPLGEPLSLAGPVAVTLALAPGANLLLAGGAGRALDALAAGLLLMAAAIPVERARFHLLLLAGDEVGAGALEGAVRRLPHTTFVGRRRDVGASVQRVHAAWSAAPVLDHGPPLRWEFLVIVAPARVSDLSVSDSLSFDAPPAAAAATALQSLLHGGSERGVHIIVWTDTVRSLERSLGSRALESFQHRLVFQTTADESQRLTDDMVATHCGMARAVVHDASEGTNVKIRPYGPPSAMVLDRLAPKGGSRA